MKSWSMILAMVAVAVAGAAGLAADEKPAAAAGEKRAAATVRVIGLHVAKPLPDEVRRQFDRMFREDRQRPTPATRVTILVHVPDVTVIDVNPNALRVDSFADDRGADLSAGRTVARRARDAFPEDTAVGPDGHHVTLEVGFANPPTAGAKSVKFRGTLKVTAGRDVKTAEVKGMPLKVGQEIVAGAATLTLRRVGESGRDKTVLSFDVGGEATRVKDVTLLDKDGNVIPFHTQRRGSIADRDPQLLLLVSAETREPTVRVSYYDRAEAVTVPVEFEAGVGL